MGTNDLLNYTTLLVYALVAALCVFGTYHLFGKKWARACMVVALLPLASVALITVGVLVTSLLEPSLPPCSAWVHFNCR